MVTTRRWSWGLEGERLRETYGGTFPAIEGLILTENWDGDDHFLVDLKSGQGG